MAATGACKGLTGHNVYTVPNLAIQKSHAHCILPNPIFLAVIKHKNTSFFTSRKSENRRSHTYGLCIRPANSLCKLFDAIRDPNKYAKKYLHTNVFTAPRIIPRSTKVF